MLYVWKHLPMLVILGVNVGRYSIYGVHQTEHMGIEE